MYNARMQSFPKVPENLEEFKTSIREHMRRFGQLDEGEQFFETEMIHHAIALFVVRRLIQLAENCEEIHLDGTFKIVPRKPKSRQLFVIMVVFQDYVSDIISFISGLNFLFLLFSLPGIPSSLCTYD